MNFRQAVLAAGIALALPGTASAQKLDPEAQKYFVPAFTQVCKTDKEVKKLPQKTSDRLCSCVGKKLTNALTMADLINGKLATGAEAQKVSAIFDKKVDDAYRSCARGLR